MKPIGKVIHYYGKVKVAVVELHGDLKVGDGIRIEKEGCGFDQIISSMQIDKDSVQSAKKGETVAIKVAEVVRKGSLVLVYQ